MGDQHQVAWPNLSSIPSPRPGRPVLRVDHNKESVLHRTLSKLPPGKPVLSAYHLQISAYFLAGKRLDLASGMGPNKRLDAFHVPPSLLLGNGGFMQAVQIVIIKAHSGTSGWWI